MCSEYAPCRGNAAQALKCDLCRGNAAKCSECDPCRGNAVQPLNERLPERYAGLQHATPVEETLCNRSKSAAKTIPVKETAPGHPGRPVEETLRKR